MYIKDYFGVYLYRGIYFENFIIKSLFIIYMWHIFLYIILSYLYTYSVCKSISYYYFQKINKEFLKLEFSNYVFTSSIKLQRYPRNDIEFSIVAKYTLFYNYLS